MTSHVIVANSERIRVFCHKRDGRLVEFEHFAHPLCRSTPSGENDILTPNEGWQQRAGKCYYIASLLAAYLDDARTNGNASSFFVAAPSAILLLLRTALGEDGAFTATAAAEEMVDLDYQQLLDVLHPKLTRHISEPLPPCRMTNQRRPRET